MTDGIIQETFKEYIGSRQLEQEPNVNYDKYDMLEFVIHIQQELIEKIKQEFPDIFNHTEHTYKQIFVKDVLRKLIGDID